MNSAVRQSDKGTEDSRLRDLHRMAKAPPMEIVNVEEPTPFITLDGSEIRELLAYRNSAILNQSLAEARLPIGGATQAHYHARAEEIYYITHGTGRIRLGTEERDVRSGDAIAIPPGVIHKLWNTGDETLRLLCCCAPAYEHSDTFITEPENAATPAAQRAPEHGG